VLTGIIPTHLIELTDLRRMALSDNKLEGILPPGMSSVYTITMDCRDVNCSTCDETC
jgi:hypothetical protein